MSMVEVELLYSTMLLVSTDLVAETLDYDEGSVSKIC